MLLCFTAGSFISGKGHCRCYLIELLFTTICAMVRELSPDNSATLLSRTMICNSSRWSISFIRLYHPPTRYISIFHRDFRLTPLHQTPPSMKCQSRMKACKADTGQSNHSSIQSHKCRLIIPQMSMESARQLSNTK